MNKKLIIAGAGLALLGAACSPGNNFRDVEGADSEVPDVVRVFSNVDKHPNVVMLCIEGAGFATTSRDYSALTRVETWDEKCEAADRKKK